MLYNIIKAVAAAIIKIFFPTKVYGKENFVNEGCIIVCNHFSAWDVPLTATNIPYRLIFLGKKELFKNRLLGFIYKKLGGISVNRENVSPGTLREVIKKLKEGKKMLLFPEGTRNRSNSEEIASLKNGAAMFALLANVPVVPMAILKKPRPFKRNVLMIGGPLYFNELKGSKEASLAVSAQIKEKMDALREKGLILYNKGRKS